MPEPILSQDFMVNVIRSYGTSVQSPVSGHLEQSLEADHESAAPQARDRAKPFTAARCVAAAAHARKKATRRSTPVRLRDSEKDRDESNLTK